jgi:ABC-type antimicrobial peptide transport system permease subunit
VATNTQCVLVVAIFVFGRMLQRRREYVVLLAQGLPARRLQFVFLDQARYAAAGGLVAGLIVGNGLGVLLIQALRPLFILAPVAALPAGRIVVLIGLLALASLGSALSALAMLGRPTRTDSAIERGAGDAQQCGDLVVTDPSAFR